jgi:hypothetical protein
MRALLALGLFAAAVSAQPEPKPEKGDSKTITKVYDTAHLTGTTGTAGGVPNTDAVLKLLLETFPHTKSEYVERDGGKIEVRATAKVHEEINGLLDALARLQDLAIDIKADVYELDATGYEKLLKALPKSAAKAPVLFAMGDELKENEPLLGAANDVLKTARLVQTSKARFANGAEATVSARRTVVRVASGSAASFVKDGFALVVVPVVSADRRFVRFKLVKQSTAVVGTRKRELGEIKGQKIVAVTPLVEDLGGTGSATVPDGSSLLFKIAYAPKDKVWVVKLDATIFIQAERDALKRIEEEKKKDKK